MKLLKMFGLIGILVFNAPTIRAADEEPANAPTTGTVAETMVSGGYVYLKIEEQDLWIATSPLPQPLSVGDKVNYSGGMEMRDFYSKTLDRTFASIYFIQNVSLASQDADVMHAAAMNTGADSVMDIPKNAAIAAPVAGEIKPLKEGKTVAAILAESSQLNGQKTSLNARVTKVSENIMGKNWITLQDGTGTEPDNKILATSMEKVTAGDRVVATGIVRTDIDLGYDYKYAVIMEEVTFSPGLE